MTVREDLGLGFGKVLSAATYIGSALRDARIFHPEGELLRSVAEIETDDPLLKRVARKLSGPALLRFSAGIFRDEESHFDILGCALRLGWKPQKPLDEHGVQDLVLGTFKSILTLPFAPLTTNTHDYLANIYYSVTPYRAEQLGKVEFRLQGEGSEQEGKRTDNLHKALEGDGGVMHLQIRREAWMATWEPLLTIRLQEVVTFPDERLFFTPFHDGKKIHPVGFINYIRKKTYDASRAGRLH